MQSHLPIFSRKKKHDIIKVTNNGSLFIEKKDFFKQEKFKKTLNELLDSDIIKNLNNRKLHNSMK